MDNIFGCYFGFGEFSLHVDEDVILNKVVYYRCWPRDNDHSHCQDFDVHNLLSELLACSGVVYKGAIVIFKIPGGIDTVIVCLNSSTYKRINRNNNKLWIKCNIDKSV